MNPHKHFAALVVSAASLVFISDILMFAVMTLAMGFYFGNLSVIGFGVYDLVLAALLAKSHVDNENSA